jgi:hypothetical protein
MDPVTVAIVVILGKYALDKGAEIAPVIGAQALAVGERLFRFVFDRLTSKGTEKEVIARGFERDPAIFEKPFAKILDEEMRSDARFAAEVHKLVDEYNRSVEAHSGGDEYKIRVGGAVTGTGFVVGSGTVSAGRDIVGGNKKTQ